MRKIDLLIENAQELLTLADGPNRPRTGVALRRLGIIEGGSVAAHCGKIVAVGKTEALRRRFRGKKTIDARGKTVLPGFVDAHTHPVFAKTREHEFEMRVMGKTYLEIAAQGGGIISAVRSVREATKQELTRKVRTHLNRFLSLGTTTIEAKSGYGLSTDSEIKSLEALRDAAKGHPVEVVPTFLGAHEIPPEYRKNREGYIRSIVEEMLPLVKRKKLAQYCDVFCEKGVFTVSESRRILNAAKKLGFGVRLHADEFFDSGGAALAAEIGAVSADHLGKISREGIRRLARAGVIAVLLPGTAFYVKMKHDAPARKLIESKVIVALATDFNPGSCYSLSMPAMINLAALRYGMLPAESVTAATLNAAFAIGRGKQIGSFHRGKQADILICDVPNHKHFAYEFGRSPVEAVVKKGKIVFRRARY